MSPRAWSIAAPAHVLALVWVVGVSAQAPERTPVSVDYVGVEGVYLPIGSDQGLSVGDTLVVYASEEAGAPGSRLQVVSVSRRRSVLSFLGGEPWLRQGEVVYALLPTRAPTTPDTAVPLEPVAAVPGGGAVGTPPGPRISGRIGLDLDGRESRTSWEGELFGETRRRFATSVGRLSVTASDLPGGLLVRGNLRAAYRYDDGAIGIPQRSIRVYELSVEKRFSTAPLSVRVGRFYNPHERYSGFWDGLLVRVGGRTVGVGAVAGFEPSRSNEGFTTDLPKVSGFADLRLGGRAWRYGTDVSVHWIHVSPNLARTFLGWSQAVRLGPLSVSQHLRMDRALGGSTVSVGRLQLRGAMDVWGPFTLQAGFSRRRPGLPGDTLSILGPVREERSAGFLIRDARGGLSADAALLGWGEGPDGRSVALSAYRRVGDVFLRANGRYWTREAVRSLALGPSVRFPAGPMEVDLAYQRYRTDRDGSALTSHTGDVDLTFRLGSDLRATLGAQQQWGSNFGGTRLHLGFWRSF